jgi:putative redox protein
MATTMLNARWSGEALDFIGTDTKGNNVPMGGDAPSPGQMLLIALAGCTGMDIVSILKKKRVEISEVEVRVIAQQPDQYPKPYNPIEVEYIVRGKSVDPAAVARAIELSKEKYCIVSQTLQLAVEMTSSFAIEEK